MTDHQILLVTLIATIIGIIGTFYLTHRGNQHFAEQNRIMLNQGGGRVPEQYRPPKWPMLTMVGLVVLVWIVAGYDIYLRRTAAGNLGSLFMQWLGANENKLPGGPCTAVIDSSQLLQWSDKYRLSVACGIVDPTEDALEDTRISISHPFIITGVAITVTTNYSKEMADGVTTIVNTAIKGMPPPPKGAGIVVQWYRWYRVILLPVGFDMAAIHQLSDVTKYGGVVLPQSPAAPMMMVAISGKAP